VDEDARPHRGFSCYQGGPVTLGAAMPGTITQGDLDVWTVSATAGEHITLNISETSETDDFRPWIRLRSPSGAVLGNTSGLTSAAITNVTVPTTGTYLILVGSFDSGFDGIGTYNLTVTGPAKKGQGQITSQRLTHSQGFKTVPRGS